MALPNFAAINAKATIKKHWYFILGIVLGFLIILYGISLSNRTSAIGIGIIVMGIDVVLLPFTTPETVSLLGYQKSKLAGRLLGILLIAVGI